MICSNFCAQIMEKDRQCTYKKTLMLVRVSIFAAEKKMSVIYFECVSVVLVIEQCKSHVPCLLSSVAFPSLQFSSTLHHKGHDFRKIY
jgi:hypothetical protein